MANIFKKKTKASESKSAQSAKSKDASDNPYLTARRTWNEHVGSLVSAKQTWQFIGIVSLMIALAAVGGIVHIGSQSKFVPYIVQVDKLGAYQGAGIATASPANSPLIVSAVVTNFIENARLVTPDNQLQRKAILSIYAHLMNSTPARSKMDEWLNGNADENPFKRAQTLTIDTRISSVLQQTEQTWQVEWVETTRDRAGKTKNTQFMRALITVKIAAPEKGTSEETMRKNPLGIYVFDFNWSKMDA